MPHPGTACPLLPEVDLADTPAAPFSLPDLTLPVGEPRTARRVLGLYYQRVLQQFLRVPLGLVAPIDRGLYQETRALLEALARRDLRKAVTVVRPPTVSTLVQTIQNELGEGGNRLALASWLREACALVLLEMAVLGELPERGVALPRDASGALPTLRSPSARMMLAFADSSIEAVLFRPGQLELRGDGRVWVVPFEADFEAPDGVPWQFSRPYHEVVPGLYLAETDNNPLSAFEAHPDKDGNRLDLGGHSVTEWRDSLRAAIALIDAHLPRIGEELRTVVRLFVPVGYDEHRHLSASYEEAIGTIYLTLHPNPMTMTEAVVHEFSHNKLNAAFRLDPLLHNGYAPLYASPVRPDPRPLHGVVLAVHAFLPIARLYQDMLGADHPLAKSGYFRQRFREIIHINREGAATVLDNAQPTAAGQGLFAEFRKLDEHFRVYEAENWQD